jgi:regulator of sigma D
MAKKYKSKRNYSKKTKRKKYKKNKTKHRLKKSITKYQDGGFPVTSGLAGLGTLAKTGVGAWAAKKISDKFKQFSKEQMNKFMKWLLDSSMKALEETFSSVNYSSPTALKSMFNELINALNTRNLKQLKRIYDKYKSEIEKLTDFNKLKPQLLKTYKNNLIRILKEDTKAKASELKLNSKSFRTYIDELVEYINKTKTLFHTSTPLEHQVIDHQVIDHQVIDHQVIDHQRYTDPSLTPDKPTGTSEFGREYLHESFLPDTSVN